MTPVIPPVNPVIGSYSSPAETWTAGVATGVNQEDA